MFLNQEENLTCGPKEEAATIGLVTAVVVGFVVCGGGGGGVFSGKIGILIFLSQLSQMLQLLNFDIIERWCLIAFSFI